jgi:hypothetical protein
MSKTILSLFIIILFISCSKKKDADQFINSQYTVNVLPQTEKLNIDLSQKKYQFILVLLHENFKIEEIKEKLNIETDKMEMLINDLYSNGLIKLTENKEYTPTCFVLTESDSGNINKFVEKTGWEMSGISIDRIEFIKKEYSKTELAQNYSFNENSFFILGNVVHGGFQLKNIEEKLLKAEAPKRGNAKCYISIFQNYSSEKISSSDLYMETEKLINNKSAFLFGKDVRADLLIDLKLETKPLLISQNDRDIFNSIADLIFEDISNYLERKKPAMVKLYLNSNYKEQTSFREFSMWIYQLIASSSINSLIQKKYIGDPKSIAYYYQN